MSDTIRIKLTFPDGEDGEYEVTKLEIATLDPVLLVAAEHGYGIVVEPRADA